MVKEEKIIKLMEKLQDVSFEHDNKLAVYIDDLGKILDGLLIEDPYICPKCKQPKKSTCDVECYCVSLEKEHITQEQYDEHMKKVNK